MRWSPASGDSPSVQPLTGYIECAGGGYAGCFREEFASCQIERSGALHQLTRNGDGHLGMTLTPKFNPRAYTAFFRIVKLGFVKGGGDNLLFWIKSHLLPLLIISGENRYEASTRFFVDEGDLAYAAASPHYTEVLLARFRRPRVQE
jgi:hypothetical protein